MVRAVTLWVLATLLATSAAPTAAQRLWRPDDRSLITSYDDVLALATGPNEVYVATTAGLAVYDADRQRWLQPLAPVVGYPTGDLPLALAWDGTTGALWLGTESGRLFAFPPASDRWIEARFATRDPIVRIVADAVNGGLIVGVPDGWYRVSDDGGSGRPASSAGVVPFELTAEYSALRSLEGTLGLDPRLRRYALTAVVPGEQTDVFYVGTQGGGLLHTDVDAADPEWLPYGLLSRGAGAVAIDADGTWFGGDGQGPRNGISRSTSEPAAWYRSEGAVEGGPAGFVARIVSTERAIWFAASDGLYRLEPGSLESGRPDWIRYTTGEGLPADQATTVLPSDDGVDIGTLRGLAHMDRDGRVTTALRGRRVLDLARADGTLWIATDVGLHAATGGGTPTPVDGPPGLRQPVIAVAAEAGGRVFALTPDGLYTRDGTGWSGPDRRATELRDPLRLLVHEGVVWIGAEGGVLALDGASVDRWRIPVDIPEGPVRGLALSGDDLWVATPAGALRLDRTR